MAGTWDSGETCFTSGGGSVWHHYASCKVDGAGNRIELIWTYYTIPTTYVYYDYLTLSEVDTYFSDYSTLKDTYSIAIGETVYAKATRLKTGNEYDFKYYSGWPGSPLLEGSQTNVGENPPGEWRSSYVLQGNDPLGTWGVRVFDAGTSTQRCNCSFTVMNRSIEYQIDLLNTNPSQTLTYTSSSTYEDFTVQSHRQAVLIDLSKFVSPTCYFEAILCVQDASFAAYAALFDQGTDDSTGSSATQVMGSEVTAQSTSYVRVRSEAITLTSGNRYRVKIHRSGSGTQYMWIRAARIIVVDHITGGWTKGEEQIEIGQCQNINNNATHAKPLNPPVYYLYEAAKRDGTVTIYFEACFVTTTAGQTAYCYLWCKTDNTSVVTLQTTETYPPKRMRSASISLTDGKEYEVRTRAPTGANCGLSGARIIIQQSGTITKTQLIKECGSYEYGDVEERNMHQTLYDASRITPTKTIYYETCLRSSSVAYTVFSDLYNATGSAAVSGSQMDTSSSSTVLLRSGALILATGKEYDSRGWRTTGGTYYVSKARVIIDVALAEVDTYASDYSTLKDTYSIGETVYAKAKGLSTQAGWLSGWDKRVKLTIDQNDVDADLTNFPVLIYLSTSSGRNSEDVSSVFDELQSDANRKKIAVTRSDGTTQCFVEIERWVQASEKAWLWVKVPSVSGTADTDLYLYYDKDHADNIVRVGDVGESPAQQVWASDFRGVWHLSESSGTAKDSTPYARSGAYSGSPYTQGVSGKIDSASDFGPSSTGSIGCGDPSDGHLDFSSNSFTVEFWVNYDGPVSGYFEIPLYKGGSFSGDPGYDVEISQYSPYNIYFQAADGTYQAGSPQTATPQDTWTYFVGVCDRSAAKIRLFKDGTEVGTGNSLGSLGSVDSTQALVFPRGTSSYLEDLTLDEVRISYGRRSDAWIKATNESGRDHLIDFGGEQTGPRYDFKYYSDWTGSPVEEGVQLDVAESPSGEWRSLYTLLSSDPSGTWGVRVYDTGTTNLRCSCSFTVTGGAPEFAYGPAAAIVACFAIYLVKRKRPETNQLRIKRRVD